MKYYCTKWVLAIGIVEFDGIKKVYGTDEKDEKVYVSSSRSRKRHIFERLGVNVFETLEEAKADAIEKAKKNVESKQKARKKAGDTLRAFQAGDIKMVKE